MSGINGRLSGVNALAYMGVNATTPPQMITSRFDPTDNDFRNQAAGTLWLNEGSTPKNLWVLLDVSLKGTNRWGRIYPEASGGTNYFVTEAGTAASINGLLNILGDSNVATSGSGNTVSIGLANDIAIKGTFTAESLEDQGVLRSDASGVIYNLADPTVDGQVMISSSTGGPVWASLTAGANVTVTPGHNSITISASGGSGGELTFTGDSGSVTATAGAMGIIGDSGNISTAASGSGATAKVTISMNNSPTFSDTTTSLLTITDLTTAGVVVNDSSGNISTSKGLNGEILISSTSGVPSWETLTAGDNISITNASNSITIASDATFHADSTNASMTTGTFKFLGDGGNITTAASTPVGGPQIEISMASAPTFSGTLTAGSLKGSDLEAGVVLSDSSGVLSSSDPEADGKVLISSSVAAPAWHTLTAGANVSITEGPGTITIAAGSGGGALTFTADGSTSTTASTGTVELSGDGTNLTTAASGTGATAKVTFSMSSTPDFSSVETVDLNVTGQPTFENIGNGLIASTALGVLSAVAPTTAGQVMVGKSTGGFLWSTLNAGSGISITNSDTSPYITIATPAPTTFTGTTGSATTAGGMKILGDLGNISTAASGTGATAQVAISMSTTPSFSGLTVSTLSEGIATVDATGDFDSIAPTVNGQLLMGAADGSFAWNTITAGSGVSLSTTGANLTISSTGTGGVTTFTGDSGTATPASTLKILGDSGNITTTASGTGSSAQVAVAISSSPTFSGTATAGTLAATTGVTVPTSFLGVLQANALGVVSGSAGANGQLLIGKGASTAPAWANLTAGTNIQVTNGSGSISLATVSSPTFSTITATQVNAQILAASSALELTAITTAGILKNNSSGVVSSLANGTNGQYLQMVSGAPAWANLSSEYLTGGTAQWQVVYYDTASGHGDWGNLVAGSGITLTPSGGNMTISASGSSGGSWTLLSPGIGTDTCYSVTNAQGTWLVVNGISSVATATDPAGTWTTHSVSTALTLYSTCYANGYWAAVGHKSAGPYLAYGTSPSSWSTTTLSGTAQLATASNPKFICYGAGYWVTGGYYYGTSHPAIVYNTVPNTTFTGVQLSTSLTQPVIDGIYVPGTGFVVLVDGGTIYTATTPSGSWTSPSTVSDFNVTRISYSQGYYVISTTTANTVYISDDLVHWQTVAITASAGCTTVYNANNKWFLAGASTVGGTGIAKSTNLYTWAGQSVSGGTVGNIQDIAYSNGVYLAVGTGGQVWQYTE